MSHHGGGLLAQTAGHWNVSSFRIGVTIYWDDLQRWLAYWLAQTPVERGLPKGRFPAP